MCFVRLIGAATGLEAAQGGAHDCVEGHMDRKGTVESNEQQKTRLSWCHLTFFV